MNRTIHKARYIKPDDGSWKRHDIQPAIEQHTSNVPLISLLAACAVVLGLMLYGAVQIDNKHGAPRASEAWSIEQ